jgi:purine-nucleoside phosphorylase
MKHDEDKMYLKAVDQAAAFIQAELKIRKKAVFSQLALILGSGLGGFAETLEKPVEIPFAKIPGFPKTSVEGHSGSLVAGCLEGHSVVCLKGRVHSYEGYDPRQVTFPVRVLGRLGIRILIVTNAAGGINPHFRPADLMLLSDHISSFIPNPLTGKNIAEFGTRFPDLSEAYSLSLQHLAKDCASRLKVKLQTGVYLAVPGPSYESPAEIRMFRILGADAVGMSTVPEVIVARHMGIACLGISIITNMAAGLQRKPLSHQEVLVAGEKVKPRLARLLRAVVLEITNSG